MSERLTLRLPVPSETQVSPLLLFVMWCVLSSEVPAIPSLSNLLLPS